MIIGQIAVIKITKIADGFGLRKIACASGNHAKGATGRNNCIIGSIAFFRNGFKLIIKPIVTPTTAASKYPTATR